MEYVGKHQVNDKENTLEIIIKIAELQNALHVSINWNLKENTLKMNILY